jgi:hypothetical protein
MRALIRVAKRAVRAARTNERHAHAVEKLGAAYEHVVEATNETIAAEHIVALRTNPPRIGRRH